VAPDPLAFCLPIETSLIGAMVAKKEDEWVHTIWIAVLTIFEGLIPCYIAHPISVYQLIDSLWQVLFILSAFRKTHASTGVAIGEDVRYRLAL